MASIWNDRPKRQVIPKIRLLSGGRLQKTLFPGNLDRREGTCLESAVDLLIPEGRHSLVGQRITQQPLSCGGVLPTFVGSYLTCRAFTHQHFGTTSPSLGHSAPRGLALKVSRKPRHLLAFGSVSQKFLGQIHWPLSDERCHLNQGAAERFRSSYEGAKQRYLGSRLIKRRRLM